MLDFLLQIVMFVKCLLALLVIFHLGLVMTIFLFTATLVGYSLPDHIVIICTFDDTLDYWVLFFHLQVLPEYLLPVLLSSQLNWLLLLAVGTC